MSRYIFSCDIAWYGICYYDISRYVMRYHTGSHRNNRRTNPQSRCGLRFLLAFCLGPLLGLSFFLPAFFVVLPLAISGTQHRTDRITSKKKQKPCPLRARPAPWAHVRICLFLFHLFVFFPFISFFPCFFAFLIPLPATLYLLTRYLVYLLT